MWKAWIIVSVGALAVGCGSTTRDLRTRDAHPSVHPRDTSRAVWGEASNPWSRALSGRCEAYLPLLDEAAQEHQLDAALLVGIVRVESSFRSGAVSGAGAQGLMQVMPRNGRKLDCGDLTDPESNIACGVKVLKGFLRYYDDDIVYALSGYNAGFAQPNKARREGRLPKNRSYVEKVLAARTSYLRHGCGS